MLYNLQGRNYQKARNYLAAENSFKSSVHLLPGRIYPYYLLAKLYAEPMFFDKDKVDEMASIVLLKKPKVESKAIDEMRSDMIELLQILHAD